MKANIYEHSPREISPTAPETTNHSLNRIAAAGGVKVVQYVQR